MSEEKLEVISLNLLKNVFLNAIKLYANIICERKNIMFSELQYTSRILHKILRDLIKADNICTW